MVCRDLLVGSVRGIAQECVTSVVRRAIMPASVGMVVVVVAVVVMVVAAMDKLQVAVALLCNKRPLYSDF